MWVVLADKILNTKKGKPQSLKVMPDLWLQTGISYFPLASLCSIFVTSFLDIDKCSEAGAVKMNNCHLNASCINTQGSYNCFCNPTYIGDGFNC